MTVALEHKSPLLEASLREVTQDNPRAWPQWLSHLKAEALKRVHERGLPHPKMEAWRASPLNALLSIPFRPASYGDEAKELPSGAAWLAPQLSVEPIVIINGRLSAQSKALTQPLADGLAFQLGRGASIDAPFVALNTACFTDVAWLRLAASEASAQVMYIVHAMLPGQSPQIAHPRVVINAEPRSRWTVIEHFVGQPAAVEPAFCNAVTEVIVGQDAQLEHVRIIDGGANDYTLAQVAVRQEHASRYESRSFALGGVWRREDVQVQLADQQSESSLEGLYVIGDAEFSGHYTDITHVYPHTRSHEHYRGVLGGKSLGVFDGTIAITNEAQDSQAHQENRNLLLGGDAVIHTKPHLQIDADNVRCSHGATVGHLDDEQLFYLRARGIGAAEAKLMLILAFLNEIVETVQCHPVRAALLQRVKQVLPSEITEERP